MFTKPEEFIVENFKSMPMWVRIVTYFIVLLVGVYGYVAPKVVVGVAEMKLDEKSSKSQPMKSRPLVVFQDGRPMKLITSELGVINIPSSSIFPTEPLEIHLYPNGYDGDSLKAVIPLSDLMRGRFRLMYIEESDKLILAKDAGIMKRMSMGISFNIISSALASESKEQEQIEAIQKYVINRVAYVSRKDVGEITPKTQLSDLSMSEARRAYLYADLEDKYKVVVWSEIWNEAVTVGDLVKILIIAINNTADSSANKKEPRVAPVVETAPVVDAPPVAEVAHVVDNEPVQAPGYINMNDQLHDKCLIEPSKYKSWRGVDTKLQN